MTIKVYGQRRILQRDFEMSGGSGLKQHILRQIAADIGMKMLDDGFFIIDEQVHLIDDALLITMSVEVVTPDERRQREEKYKPQIAKPNLDPFEEAMFDALVYGVGIAKADPKAQEEKRAAQLREKISNALAQNGGDRANLPTKGSG